MNPAFKTELRFGGGGTSGMKWRQPPPPQCFLNGNDQHLQNMFSSMPLAQSPQQPFPGLITNPTCVDAVKPDPDGWAGLQGGAYGGDQLGFGYMNQNTVLNMTNCTPAVGNQTFLQGHSASGSGSVSVSVSPKKRKSPGLGTRVQQNHRKSRNA